MTYEEALKKCNGECDYCEFKRTVKGTEDRIDREPAYYCYLTELLNNGDC